MNRKDTTRVHVRRVILPLALVALLSAGCQPNPDTASLQNDCTQLADALAMPHPGQGNLRETDDGYEFWDGELMCKYDGNGNISVIACYALASDYGQGVPVVKDRQQAIDIATEAVAMADFAFEGEVYVTEEPWEDGLPDVSVKAEPLAFGYHTNGYAGQTVVVINRFTGDVHSIYFASKRVPDRPNILAEREDAVSSAEALVRGSAESARYNKVGANLQYYAAIGSHATGAGRSYEMQKRLRLCWMVLFYSEKLDPETGETIYKTPVAAVAIDAETGEVLETS